MAEIAGVPLSISCRQLVAKTSCDSLLPLSQRRPGTRDAKARSVPRRDVDVLEHGMRQELRAALAEPTPRSPGSPG